MQSDIILEKLVQKLYIFQYNNNVFWLFNQNESFW